MKASAMKPISAFLMVLMFAGGAVATTPVIPGICNRVPLNINTVTTGGTAVTALDPGNKTAGGWLYNPSSATINLCINENGTASGTTSQGDLTCIIPGQKFTLTPGSGPVSVVSSDSSHPFSGQGCKP